MFLFDNLINLFLLDFCMLEILEKLGYKPTPLGLILLSTYVRGDGGRDLWNESVEEELKPLIGTNHTFFLIFKLLKLISETKVVITSPELFQKNLGDKLVACSVEMYSFLIEF